MAAIRHNLPWIESPFFQGELEEAELSESDRRFVKSYAEEGFAILDPGIPESVIDDLIAGMSPRFSGAGSASGKPTTRIQDAWKYNEQVKQVAIWPAILEKLALLYRRRPIPFQTLNFNVGTQQATHSDMIHFSSVPERFMCGVWIAFEDITPDNGPLHYYPGSHVLPFFEMSDMGILGSESVKMKNGYMDYEGYYVQFIREVIRQKKLEKKILTIRKGQALIWAANLLHGGERINTPGMSRHSQVSHYYFEDCVYYTPLFSDLAIKQIFLRDIIDISTGKRVSNKYLGKIVKGKGRGFREALIDLVPQPLIRAYRAFKKKN